MKNFKELRKEIQHHLKNVELDEIHAPGTKVRVPHKGKAVPGKVVRHDKGDKHGSPFYVVDVGEYESPKVPAHQVRTEEVEQIDEENKPTNPELWSKAKALARSKFDVYPSAYANGWAAKWYKSKGGEWKSVNEDTVEEGAVPADPKKVVTLRHKTSGKEIRVVDRAVKDYKKQGWDEVKTHKEDVEHIIETRRMSAAAKLSRAFDRLESRHEAAKTHEQKMQEKGRKEFEKNHPEHAKKPVGEETEFVAEGFDDHKAIAHELIKRHGDKVNLGHVKAIAGERDSRGSLDHDEVMHHVNKILGAQKSWKKVTGWKKVKPGSPMRRASGLAQKGMQNEGYFKRAVTDEEEDARLAAQNTKDTGWKKAKPDTVRDKSGAVHSPRSRARHLAQMAMQAQIAMQAKKPVKEETSRKAQIVKEAASAAKKKKKKSNDIFQDEPILNNSQVKM